MKTKLGKPTTDAMRKYCDEYKIALPSVAPKTLVEALITRAAMHMRDVKTHPEFGCFGWWESDNMNCQLCKHQDDCSSCSTGMTLEQVGKLEAKIDRKDIRFARTMSKVNAKLDP